LVQRQKKELTTNPQKDRVQGMENEDEVPVQEIYVVMCRKKNEMWQFPVHALTTYSRAVQYADDRAAQEPNYRYSIEKINLEEK
jgi:hypothetical protein